MARFVFLDIDGVLNDHTQHPRTGYCSIDRDKAGRLDRVLFMADAGIVLTSAWRYLVHNGSMTLEGLRNLLRTHWIDGDRLVGITRRDISPNVTDRGAQISEWIVGEGWQHYGEDGAHVVLDDMDLGIGSAGHPFIQVDSAVGLTDADADRAIQMLRAVPLVGERMP
jgi:hypothetical protein